MQIIITTKMALLYLMLVLNIVAAKAQNQQGIMNRLIEIKYSSELYLTNALKQNGDGKAKDSALAI